jgi:hypothetical protein
MVATKSNGAAAVTQEAAPKSNSEILEDVLSNSLYESLVSKGDISDLSVAEKGSYLQRLCESLKLNPLTQPFTFLKLNGKEVPYANRSCTDQLAHLHQITREILKTEYIQDVYVVTCKASMPSGRSDISTGAVNVKGLSGDNLANALMKAETKSKRRVVLSICGLGFLDESELDTIPRERMERLTPPPVQQTTSAPKPASKAELVEKAKETIETDGLKSQITKLGKAIGMEESAEKTLKFIDDNPKEAERAYCKAVRVSFKKLTESEKWPYGDEGTTAYLEKHGITVLDDASRGQLESLVNQLETDGLLTD